MLQLIGTIAVVASVLVLAYQAREVVRQTRTANEVSGTVAHRELVFQWERWAKVFIHRPELHGMYFGDKEPSEADRVRLAVIAEGHADWLEAGMTTERQLASYPFVTSIGYWDEYVAWVVASTPGLRKVLRDQPNTWPLLNAHLALYDSDEQHALRQAKHGTSTAR